ncbi:MAG: hypothetical protein ACR2IV_05745 [Bryobacteraceae bacterium]
MSSLYALVRARADSQIDTAATLGGLLFGTVKERKVTVESFREFALPDFDASLGGNDRSQGDFEQCFAALKDERELASGDLIGWYRFRRSGETDLLDREVEFHKRHFRRISDIALILNVENEAVSLNVFTRWANAAMSAGRHRRAGIQGLNGIGITEPVELIMQSAVDDEYQPWANQVVDVLQEKQRAEKSRALSQKGTGISIPESAEAKNQTASHTESAGQVLRQLPDKPALSSADPAERPTSSSLRLSDPAPLISSRSTALRSLPRNRKLWIISASFLAVAATLTCVWFYVGGASRWIRNAVPSAILETHTSRDLGMRVEARGDALLVSWDRRNEKIQSATSGMLEISDGSRHRKIYLNSGEIANGSLLYRPASPDVVLRLNVSGKHGATTSENVRALDGSERNHEPKGNGNRQSRMPGLKPLRAEEQRRERPNVSAGRKATANPRTQPSARTIPPDLHSKASYASSASLPLDKPPHRKSDFSRTVPTPARSSASHVFTTKSAVASNGGTRVGVQPSAATNLPGGQSEIAATSTVVSGTTAGGARHVYVPARPTKKVMPRGLSGNSVLYKPQQINVEVAIDKSGRVFEAHVASDASNDNNGSLATSALSAAKEWIFEPATLDGQSVFGHHTIEFRFKPERH